MGIPTLISTATPSGATYVTFSSGIDSTYDEYLFVIVNSDPSSENELRIDFYGNDWGETVTTTWFEARHNESDSVATLSYNTGYDAAQAALPTSITRNQDNVSSTAVSGFVRLFSPSSTTYVKHFMIDTLYKDTGAAANHTFVSGYINDTNAITGCRFSISGGTISGTFQLYGIA